MNDAVLDFRFRIHRLNRRRKAVQVVRTGNENILNAPVFQAVEYGGPEFRALILTNPHPQDILPAIEIDTDSDIDSLFHDLSFTANMVMNCVQKDNRVDRLQRPLLPLLCLGKDLIRNAADRGIRDLYTINIPHVSFNVAGSHTLRIHGNDLCLNLLTDTGLILLQNDWIKFAFSITGNGDLNITKAGPQCLAATPCRLNPW